MNLPYFIELIRGFFFTEKAYWLAASLWKFSRGRHDRMVVVSSKLDQGEVYNSINLILIRLTTLCDKVCQWLATGQWFSPIPPVSSINKTYRHAEILLKVVLNTIKQTEKLYSIGVSSTPQHQHPAGLRKLLVATDCIDRCKSNCYTYDLPPSRQVQQCTLTITPIRCKYFTLISILSVYGGYF
jgi:hypothetical protein